MKLLTFNPRIAPRQADNDNERARQICQTCNLRCGQWCLMREEDVPDDFGCIDYEGIPT